MKILLTGATGFVGHGILERLLEAGHEVRCLLRKNSALPEKWMATGRVELAHGDILDTATLPKAMAGTDAVIHLVGIIREHRGKGVTFERVHVQGTKNMVNVAKSVGVPRFVHMSALGARPDAVSMYHKTKWEAEEYVRNSGLNWTVFRPSVIFGPGDEFVNMLADVLRKTPVFPIFGSGRYSLQPVARENVAAGFVKALELPETIGRAYEVGGPEPIPYRQMLQRIARAIGKKGVVTVPVPVFLVKPVVKMMEGFPFFPLTTAQLTMLLEGNTCDPLPYSLAFDVALQPFDEGIRDYL
ncbi:complex I NDUFA9 subunit family protein [Tumebacillus sp. DT12]|uniref:Complex I NDUFA9 subunit family protein n=1 Tax=Tumebacillus lacus TaxID=2995335 RepID=A0ABT3X436_9BACL|nr:complex I NDUFA9 subunit family protein [Tumebacillus lacus]MCX7570592.1 complex I NDUFA9 subunit family protein [Tumebacillus lacus]